MSDNGPLYFDLKNYHPEWHHDFGLQPELIDRYPVIKFVDQLIQEAITKQISDIHIEPYEQHCRIRFRRDGLLYEASTIPPLLADQVSLRLKIMSKLNISEKRLPQDGRIQIRHPNKIDIRISTCPTLFGEKIVLRIQDTHNTRLSIDSLGMNAQQQALFHEALNSPQGLILVTGPTGSGKTMTLYAALNRLNQIDKNISTVEDPIEIELPGINQININPRIGLDFATILRALLRQDPDILMVGEIRDLETATIALQAAQTGHLILSTLHTNTASETLSRLQSMGTAAHLLDHAILLIIAQRLIRKRCQLCDSGCEHCHQGYAGRTGIFELLPIKMSHSPGLTIQEAGLEKIQQGISDEAELQRVLG